MDGFPNVTSQLLFRSQLYGITVKPTAMIGTSPFFVVRHLKTILPCSFKDMLERFLSPVTGNRLDCRPKRIPICLSTSPVAQFRLSPLFVSFESTHIAPKCVSISHFAPTLLGERCCFSPFYSICCYFMHVTAPSMDASSYSVVPPSFDLVHSPTSFIVSSRLAQPRPLFFNCFNGVLFPK